MRRVHALLFALVFVQPGTGSAGPLEVRPLPGLVRPTPAFVASASCEGQVDTRLNTIVTHVVVRNTGVATLAAGTPIEYDLGGGLVLTFPLEQKLARGETAVAFDRVGRFPTCSAKILHRGSIPPGVPNPPKPPVGVGLRCETEIGGQAGDPATQAYLVNDGTSAVPSGTRIRVSLDGTSGSTSVDVNLAATLAPGERKAVLIFPVEGSYERCKADLL